MSFCNPMTSSVRSPWAATVCAAKINAEPSKTKTIAIARRPGERSNFSPIVIHLSPRKP